jgi:hypothetical protein
MQFYKLRVKGLSPTQFATGRAELVLYRAGRMAKKFAANPEKLHDYLLLRTTTTRNPDPCMNL